ncbi:hypothetical protein PG994_005132 [Apiospora phragmitis]|uniref:Uncharacterized protein n=1 Tax=Apiospora phragmitis TaxID=2905665 RepID=A0ABR1VSJ9_9PEZI
MGTAPKDHPDPNAVPPWKPKTQDIVMITLITLFIAMFVCCCFWHHIRRCWARLRGRQYTPSGWPQPSRADMMTQCLHNNAEEEELVGYYKR